MSAIHASHVSFSYTTAVAVIDDASFDLGPGWTGLVGANGVGKSTLLSIITGEHPPDSGTVTLVPTGTTPILCEQRVDEQSERIVDFGASWDREAVRLRARLALDPVDLDRWKTLSPGERKRWQIGAALAARPDILLLDEPTNHLDGDARDLLLGALRGFRGCGIVVSHDRSLLQDLTSRTLRIARGRVELWNGPYDVAHAGWTARAAEELERLDRMKTERKKLARRLDEQHRKTAQKDAERQRIRRNAPLKDHDARGAVAKGTHNRGQKTGAKSVETITNSLRGVTGEIDAAHVAKDPGGRISFPTDAARKEFLIRYTGPVSAGDRFLFDIDVAVRRTDRIHVAGPNGVGKTTLLNTLVASSSIPSARMLVLHQETTRTEAVGWLDAVRTLPPDERGRVMSLVALLGTDPGPLLESGQPSPGEARKAAMALGLGTPTWLLILDEPTNHLDLPSIERLEEALGGYPGALLLVTHDDTLAQAVTDTTWLLDGFDGLTIGCG